MEARQVMEGKRKKTAKENRKEGNNMRNPQKERKIRGWVKKGKEEKIRRKRKAQQTNTIK